MTTTQWLWLVALSILWGGAFFFIGVAVDHVPALTLVLARVAIAALVLIPVVYLMGHRLPTSSQGWVPLVGMSIFNNVIPFTAIVSAQATIPSGLASVLNGTTPIWTLLLLRVFTDDHPLTMNKIVGVILGALGVGILMGPDAFTGHDAQVIGVVLMLIATASYGASAVWGRRLSDTPPLVSSAGQLIGSSLILLPLVLIVDQPWTLSPPSLSVVAAIVGLAVVSTAVAYLIFFHIITVSGTANVMLVTLLIPVSAIALGITFLDETLLTRHIVGALVIGCGLLAIDGRLFRRTATAS